MKIPEFTLKTDIDAGAILTSVTILGGLLAWLIGKVVAAREEKVKKAKNGALRLILKILHERRGSPASIDELWKTYEADEMAAKRKIYCGYDYRIKDPTQFEAAIYALDSEGKIDFYDDLRIVFRTDRKRDPEGGKALGRTPSAKDKDRILALLRTAIKEKEKSVWELKDLAQASQVVDRQATEDLLQQLLHDEDKRTAEKAAALLFGKA